MDIDIYAKSEELIKQLANSLFDRDPTNPKPVFFSITEIHIVEKFMKDMLDESKREI
tara:strand:+ start:10570 stop:10740 length:171 start_codon:yes stop_codon:yes gene_type:complete